MYKIFNNKDLVQILLNKCEESVLIECYNNINQWKDNVLAIDKNRQFDFDEIIEYEKLDEKFLRKFYNVLDWYLVSEYQTLSEPFMEEFIKKIKWRLISQHQALSEKFIEKYRDKVCWSYIWEYQNISKQFIMNNISRAQIYINSYESNIHPHYRRKDGDKD